MLAAMRLTRDELLLVVCAVLALLLGAVVKQYRDTARFHAAASPTTPAGSSHPATADTESDPPVRAAR